MEMHHLQRLLLARSLHALLHRTLFKDLRFSVRTLRNSPGFALTAILTLAIGIGVVAAVFSVIDSVLLQPFGFPQPGRLVVLHDRTWRKAARSRSITCTFTCTFRTGKLTPAVSPVPRSSGIRISALPPGRTPHIMPGLQVSPSLFQTLGGRSDAGPQLHSGRGGSKQ